MTLVHPDLWPHQQTGAEAIATKRAVYVHGHMGTGKSRMVLEAIRQANDRQALVLCPLSVAPVWASQAARFAPQLDVQVLDQGGVTKRAKAAEAAMLLAERRQWARPLVLVVNYDAAWREPLRSVLLRQRWALVAMDESHRAKAPAGRAAKFCAELRDSAQRVCALSGTPMPHGPLDVWAQYAALDPSIFGDSFARFRVRYEAQPDIRLRADAKMPARFDASPAVRSAWDSLARRRGASPLREDLALAYPAAHAGWMPQEVCDLLCAFHREIRHSRGERFARYVQAIKIVFLPTPSGARFQRLEELRAKMDRIMLHFPRSLLTLPPETDTERYFDLGTEERRVYDDLHRDLRAAVARGEVTASNALVKLLRLQQAGCGYAVTEDGEQRIGNSREAALREVLEDIGPEPVVVVCRFHHDLDAVKRVSLDVTGAEALELSGRVKQLAEWQQPDAPLVLAVQIQSGGLGVDLTRACYMVHYSLGFSLGDYEQVRCRVHRPGQDRAVTHVHLVARDTVDVTIRAALVAKSDLVQAVLDDARLERVKATRPKTQRKRLANGDPDGEAADVPGVARQEEGDQT